MDDPQRPPRDLAEVWTPLAAAHAAAAERVAAEGTSADSAVADLLSLPEEERRRRLGEEARLRTVAVAGLLLQRSREAAGDSPDLGEELALLAADVLDRLDPGTESPVFVAELQACAWGLVAYARWLGQRWDGVVEALEQAEARLVGAGHDPSGYGFGRTLATLRRAERDAARSVVRLTEAVLILLRRLDEVAEQAAAERQPPPQPADPTENRR